ncbi:hypothetical protein N9Q58_00070 [Polaribacter sp.]|nr:hypothetical protein [Polaribacter sp.]
MKTLKTNFKEKLVLFILTIMIGFPLSAQQEINEKEDPSEPKSMAVYLNKEKTKYLWINILGQTEVNFRKEQVNFNVKRTQLFLSAKVSDRIMLSTYFTTSNLNNKTLLSSAQGDGNQLSLNGLYMDVDLIPGSLRVGAGLHYVNGISRLTNYSSFTSMTYDAPGSANLGDGFYPAWWGYGYADQFSSPLGVYVIGDFDKFHYQVSINNAMVNNFASDFGNNTITGDYTYQSNHFFQGIDNGKAAMNYQGYFEYQFLDKEWHDYTFRKGTYMGSQSVFNIGAGFFYQPNAFIRSTSGADIVAPTETILLSNAVSTVAATSFAIDVFYDAPLGDGAINAYVASYHNDFGEKGAVFGTGSGSALYGQLGYLLPVTLGKKTKLMPYFSYMSQNFDHTPNNSYEGSLGLNLFFYSHKLKLTPEYVFGKKGTLNAKSDSYFRMMLTMSL